jgi:hypothetical protein
MISEGWEKMGRCPSYRSKSFRERRGAGWWGCWGMR